MAENSGLFAALCDAVDWVGARIEKIRKIWRAGVPAHQGLIAGRDAGAPGRVVIAAVLHRL